MLERSTSFYQVNKVLSVVLFRGSCGAAFCLAFVKRSENVFAFVFRTNTIVYSVFITTKICSVSVLYPHQRHSLYHACHRKKFQVLLTHLLSAMRDSDKAAVASSRSIDILPTVRETISPPALYGTKMSVKLPGASMKRVNFKSPEAVPKSGARKRFLYDDSTYIFQCLH